MSNLQALHRQLLHAAQTHPNPRARATAQAHANALASQMATQQGDYGATSAPQQRHPPVEVDSIKGIPLGPVGVPLAPTRLLRLPVAPDVDPGTTADPVQLEFSAGAGWIIGWSGIAVDLTPGAEAAGAAEQALMGVRMFLNDGEEIITNGLAADFAPMATIFGSGQNDREAALLRWVESVDTLTVLFRNFGAQRTLRPFVTFRFWRAGDKI